MTSQLQGLPAKHSKRDHAWASPSMAYIWAGTLDKPGCPGALALANQMPSGLSGAAADEGTRAHELLELCLSQHCYDVRQTVLAPIYPVEMLNGVNVALKMVSDIRQRCPQVRVLLESEAYINELYWGHVDIVIYDPVTYDLWVIDFKYGKNVVDVQGNSQLLSYVLGVINQFPKVNTIWTCIVQPRRYDNGNPLQWAPVSHLELERWRNQTQTALAESKSSTPVYRPSYSRCRYCKGAPLCPAVVSPANIVPPNVGLAAAVRKKPGQERQERPLVDRVSGATITADQVSKSNLEAVGVALSGLPVLEAYIKNIKEISNELSLKYKLDIPGHKLVYKKGTIAWNADADTICKKLWDLGHISPAVVTPPKLIAITTAKDLLNVALQEWRDKETAAASVAFKNLEPDAREAAEKALKKRLDETVTQAQMQFAMLTTRAESQDIELVPASDERPSIQEISDKKSGFDKTVFIPVTLPAY